MGIQFSAGRPPGGMLVRDLKNPIANLSSEAKEMTRQRIKLDALSQYNLIHKKARDIDGVLDARMASFELAFRMQKEAPAAFDVSLKRSYAEAVRN